MGSHRFDDWQNQIAAIAGGGDVEKGQLISTLLVVASSNFHRIARIAQRHKIDPFDHTATGHVEAGDDAFSEHRRALREELIDFLSFLGK